ncbi:MAG: PIG-L family deacetylase [Chloroflexota bacterium]|nr:MAG: PIG-L family deacetylase [Chloroflexota bacterium]
MDKSTPSDNLTLLAVLAHPDDETFGLGGTLALYARRGVAVHLVCATRGEVGEVEPHYLEGFQSIGELRENELRCAASKLGLAGVHFLDYRDSGMPGSADNRHTRALAAAPLEEVAARVTGYIRSLRPQVVLTFDPIGGYRHPDHIAIHQATVQAFHAAGDGAQFPDQGPPFQPEKLYFHTFPRGWLTWVVRLLPLFGKDPRHFGRNGDIDLLDLVGENFPVHARIRYQEVAKAKEAATACHASQGGLASSGNWVVSLAFRLAAGVDTYTRAYPEPDGGPKETDLFAGILSP